MKKNIIEIFIISLAFSLLSCKPSLQSARIKNIIIAPNIKNFDTIFNKKEGNSTITIKVQNGSGVSILISNVESVNTHFRLERKEDGIFISKDSSCFLMVDPMLPEEGIKEIEFKNGESLNFRNIFPPPCSYTHLGDYRIKYVFVFYFKGRKYLKESDWFYYYVAKSK